MMPSGSRNRPEFYSAGFLLLVALNLSAGLNYFFQAMMRRFLDADAFSLMNSLFGLMALFALPVVIYTGGLTRRWAELANAGREEEADRLGWSFFVLMSGFCLGIALLLLGATPWLSSWFHTSNWKAMAVTAVAAGLGMLLQTTHAFTQARQWFTLLAVGSLLGALLRVGLGWMGGQYGVPLSAALMATGLSGGVVAALVFFKSRWPGLGCLDFRTLNPVSREFLAPLLAAFAIFCITQSDLLVIRTCQDVSRAGLFADVIILARIMFFLIGPLGQMILPKTATGLLEDGAVRETRVVRRALGLGILVLVPSAAVLTAAAPWAVQCLRGTSSPETVDLLRMASWCLIPISLCQLIIPSMVARRQERFLQEFTLLSLLLPATLAIKPWALKEVFVIEGTVGVLLLVFAVWRSRKNGAEREGTSPTMRSKEDCGTGVNLS